MADKIKNIDDAIHAIVQAKNHPFLMSGQSCVEWFRYAMFGGQAAPNNNFVPIMRQLRHVERKMNAEKNAQHDEGKLTNIITFGLGLASIFAQNINEAEEKKLPIFDYYIGHNLKDEVHHENKNFLNTLEQDKIIIVLDIELKDCVDINPAEWKQPVCYSIGTLKVIEGQSSHYLYLGYLYLLALAWHAGANIVDICSVDLVLEYVNQNYQNILIKPAV